MLSEDKWEIVENLFGPHSVDLMAVDSNVMRYKDGNPMRHFTPHPTRLSAGINVFSQDLSVERNPYVFPPFGLIFPLLKFFKDCKIGNVTMIIPDISPRPVWWPLFCSHVKKSKILCMRGEVDALYFPGKKGFAKNKVGLKWSLLVARLCFNN
jgi:hypothetical protein